MAGRRIANLSWFHGHDNADDAQWTYAELMRRVAEAPAAADGRGLPQPWARPMTSQDDWATRKVDLAR